MSGWSLEATLQLKQGCMLHQKRGPGRARQRKKREKKLLAVQCTRCGTIHRWVHPKHRPTEQNLAKLAGKSIQEAIDAKIFADLARI